MTTPDSVPRGWTATYGAITLFAQDLVETKDFYRRAFQTEPIFEDDDSVVFRIGGTIINLLIERAVPELIEPARMAPASAGARAVYTLQVADVDAVVAELSAAGVDLLNGPMNRPWGPRTASFRDPSGHIWEIAK
ncbi:MAG: VOC family protein [Candidatus Eisenbacteria bacterium]|uniref:VOC family protein n=1 Tax=Eiseniibacteriota bacterium TaxID=2212470 RepID=A0A956LWH1_UNCEI|nr:VOC family protein [Candidatus Eisenbacteria bacterium]